MKGWIIALMILSGVLGFVLGKQQVSYGGTIRCNDNATVTITGIEFGVGITIESVKRAGHILRTQLCGAET